MKNFTQELKNVIKEDPGVPIMDPDELRARSQTIVILTNEAPKELLALAGPDRKATLLSIDPPMITLPYQKGVFKVSKDAIVFENHHSGRDVSEAGADETPYEKFFSQAMKKFGVSSPIELDPEDTKKFFNYVDKNWEAEEESDGSNNEIAPLALVPIAAKLAGGAAASYAVDKALQKKKKAGTKDEEANEDAEGGMSMGQMASDLGGGTSNGTASILRRPDDDEDDEETTEDVTTGKVGKKDKGSYQHAYKLALKKYQIHSADELDTPAERKGFTDYVDRLWKKGDIHRDKKEGSIDQTEWVGSALKLGVAGAKALAKSKTARKAVKGAAKGVKKMATSDTTKRLAKKGVAAAGQQAKKFAGSREGKRMKKKFSKAAEKRGVEMISGFGKKKEKPEPKPPSKTKEASIPEGVKKTPGVSKKAKGAVGFAKHARKGTGAKRQFQKGVRQAGKKQARNEVSPPDRKHQVKGIKKHMAQKKGKDKIPKTYVDKKTGKRKETNPWALAWAQYDKYGVPSRIEKD